MAKPTDSQLRQFMLAHFSDEDVETFCFEYFPEVQDNHFGSGMSKNRKVMKLISYCRQRSIRDNLLVNLEQEREKPFRETFAQQPKTNIKPNAYLPRPRNPNQIFISHASEDADLAQQLAVDLRANGYDIFITPDSIRPGEKWVPAINRGLEESGIFLVLLTPAAVQSGWVQEETDAAIALANAGAARLYFLDVEPCQPPFLWRMRQFLAFGWQAYPQNLANLVNLLAGQASKPAPRIDVSVPAQEKRSQSTKPQSNSFIHEKTGLAFVRIPAGEFLYGFDHQQRHLPEYWQSKTPVTQAVYQRFIAANPKYDVPFGDEKWAKPYNWDQKKRTLPAHKAEHPVVLVSWYDALAFCKWAGLQLPTEEEWEKAARGTDGRAFPWGNSDPTDKLCNFNQNVKSTTPVGKYSPQGDSPYGCLDMSGNVWEWCLNKYDSPEDTTIDKSAARRVLRGGSWNFSQASARAAYRNYFFHPGIRGLNIGFRVVLRRPPSQDH